MACVLCLAVVCRFFRCIWQRVAPAVAVAGCSCCYAGWRPALVAYNSLERWNFPANNPLVRIIEVFSSLLVILCCSHCMMFGSQG
jgi:hypothetical protein